MTKHLPTNKDVTLVMDWTSMASDQTSPIMDIEIGYFIGPQVIWKNNDQSDGTFKLEISNDLDTDTFAIYPGSEKTMDTGYKSHFWNVGEQCMFRYFRVVFEHGTITAGEFKLIVTCGA